MPQGSWANGAVHQGNPGSQNAEIFLLARRGESETAQLALVGVFLYFNKPREVEKVLGRIGLPFAAVCGGSARGIIHPAVEDVIGCGGAVFVRPVLADLERPRGRIGQRPKRRQLFLLGKHEPGDGGFPRPVGVLGVDDFGKVGHFFEVGRPVGHEHALVENGAEGIHVAESDDVGHILRVGEKELRRRAEVGSGDQGGIEPVFVLDVLLIGIVRGRGSADRRGGKYGDIIRSFHSADNIRLSVAAGRRRKGTA